MAKFKGSCMCGKVTYDSEADALMTAVCHCVDCQKQSGSALSIVVGVAKSAITFNGELKQYSSQGKETGKAVDRFFCPDCGSPLYSAPEVMPDAIFLKAGTLDDPSWLKPEINMWCDTAHSWVLMDDALPKFGGNPPLG